jgi:hypothetical protein
LRSIGSGSRWSELKDVTVHQIGDPVNPDRLENSLQPPFADIFESARRDPPDLVVKQPRNLDCAGWRRRLDARGDVDPIAAQVQAYDDDICEMEAEAHIAAARSGKGSNLGARLDGGPQRIDRAGELGEQAIARRTEDTAVMALDNHPNGLEDSVDPRNCTFFIRFHRGGGADEITDHDRSQLALHSRSLPQHKHAMTQCSTSAGLDVLRLATLATRWQAGGPLAASGTWSRTIAL